MRLTPAPALAHSDATIAALQRGACHASGAPLSTAAAPLKRTSALLPSVPFLGSKQSAAPAEPHGRRCHYDGFLYCADYHSGGTAVIPANVLEAWNFQKLPVSDSAAEFLAATAAQPLLRIDARSTPLFATLPLLARLHATRARVAAMLERQRRGGADGRPSLAAARLEAALAKAGPRRYLLECSDRWSLADLIDVAQGAAFAQLPAWLERQAQWLESVAGPQAEEGQPLADWA